jgi:hypothetical protein
MECLQRSGLHTLVNPASIENYLALLTGILPVKVLSRLFIRIDKNIWYATVTWGDSTPMFHNNIDKDVSVFDVFFNIDS